MKSLEKLREWLDCKIDRYDARDSIIVINIGADKNEPYEIADEIEREIAERYMELPVDADGVPIRVGDMIERDEDGFCVIGVAPKICFVQDGLITPAKPMYYRHVKPRTLEDVLREFYHDASDADAFCTVRIDDVLDKYAAEIRELMADACIDNARKPITEIIVNGDKLPEIVRCRDCEFADWDITAWWCTRVKHYPFEIGELEGYDDRSNLNGFCAWGVRRDA